MEKTAKNINLNNKTKLVGVLDLAKVSYYLLWATVALFLPYFHMFLLIYV